MSPFLKKYIKYPAEAVVVSFIYLSSKIFGYKFGSNFMGGFFKFFGKILSPRKRVVDANLKIVFPEISDTEIKEITSGMWENWGRTTADYCNLDHIYQNLEKYVTVKNPEYVQENAIYVSAHYGNFEVAVLYLSKAGVTVSQLYRKANNKIFNYIGLYTQRNIKKKMIDRTDRNSLKQMIHAVRQKESVFLLNDQKMSTGVSLKFFGRDALTATGAAVLATKYAVPIIPVFVKRTDKHRFDITFEPHIDTSSNDINTITELINSRIEHWIREAPKMWFWIHNRWNIKK